MSLLYKIDDGEIIFKQQMIGLPQSRMFRNDTPYLKSIYDFKS